MKTKNLNLFYLHSLFFEFSDSMLGLALPIFIYQLFDSIVAVFAFQLVWNVIYMVLFIPVFNWAMHLKNPKYFLAVGVVFYVLCLYFFGQATIENKNPALWGMLFFSLYVSFYWPLRHWFFSVNSDHKKVGKQVSFMNAIIVMMGFLGPIFAGVLSGYFSFNLTFLLGSGAAFFGIIPILFFHAPPHPKQYGFKKVFKLISKPELKALRPAHFWDAFDYHFAGIGWLLAFTIFIGDILDLGLLVGFSTLLALLTTWSMGKWFDARKRKQALVRTTQFHVGTTLLLSSAVFIPHLAYVWFIQFLNQLSSIASATVNDSYLYALSNKIHPVHFHLNREIYLNLGRLVSSAILMGIFWFLPNETLWFCIGFGAFFLLGRLTVKRVDHLLH